MNRYISKSNITQRGAVFALIGYMASTSLASAACPAGKLCPPVTAIGSSLKDFIYLLISIIQAVGIPALVVFLIYAGYLLVSAGDNEEQVTKSKTYIFWTIIGAAIILGAQVIADLVFNTAALF